jgi:hypothetical protein
MNSVILQIVVILLVLHNFFYLPFSPFVLTIAAAAAAYGVTKSLIIPSVILFLAPTVKMVLVIMKTTDNFQNVGAEAVSDRVKNMAIKTPSNTAYDASGNMTTGVLGLMGSSSVENFQTVDASGGEVPGGMPGVSIPAYVREKGRLLVVPETSMARLESVDSNPRPSPALITGEDGMSVNTALTPDATQLPDADQQAVTESMSAGPVSMYA